METKDEYIKNIRLLVTQSENNIQINDISETELESIWDELCATYPNFEIFFCFNSERMMPNQTIPYDLLKNLNMEKIDDMLNFKLRNCIPSKNSDSDISLLTEDTFDEFANFHDSRNSGMFWTSARIRQKLDIWRIHILKSCGVITGYSMMMTTDKNTEIFAIIADNDLEKQAIIQATCNDIFSEGRGEVLFMIDADDVVLQKIAKNIGFKQTGFYQGFQGIVLIV